MNFVPAGVTSHNFRIFTRGVPTARTVTITASFDGVSLSRVLTVGAVAATVASITANVTNLKGGEGGVATVALSAPAPAMLLINVSTSHPTLFSSLPATPSVSKGSTTAMLGFVANKTATTTAAVTVTASYGASSRNLGLTIGPPAEATLVVSSVTLTPSTINSGGIATGTVTLSGAAPAGGASVQLSTGDVTVATVPPSVTVAAGATSATFTVAAQNVTATRTTSIWGLLNLSAAAGLTMTAGGGGGGGGAPGFPSPAANAAESGGDGNGFESNPSSALADDAASASDINSGSGTGTSCTSTGKDRHLFFNFGVAIPGGSSINGIEVRLDARADSTSGSPKMCVQLSWDGGTTWTAAKATGTLRTTHDGCHARQCHRYVGAHVECGERRRRELSRARDQRGELDLARFLARLDRGARARRSARPGQPERGEREPVHGDRRKSLHGNGRADRGRARGRGAGLTGQQQHLRGNGAGDRDGGSGRDKRQLYRHDADRRCQYARDDFRDL